MVITSDLITIESPGDLWGWGSLKNNGQDEFLASLDLDVTQLISLECGAS